jgi:acetyltransferase-like isoleucine patch superfamily enzyme
MTIPVVLPQANANDSSATLVQWLVEPGKQVTKDQPIAVFETTKVAIEVEAPAAGWLIAHAKVGDVVDVGTCFALVADEPSAATELRDKTGIDRTQRKITSKAKRLMEEYGISVDRLPAGLELVREHDVLALLNAGAAATDLQDFDAVPERADYKALMDLLSALRHRMKQKFNRHVPTGTILNDRWKLAVDQGFGEKASVYDECLILGEVAVGENCWIGPYTVLDGSGGQLIIGDWTSIGAGAQVYTHHTIDHALSGGIAKPFYAPTRIGRCCFIAPTSIIAPGTDIGDHSFVAAFSYVEGRFPPYSYIAGCPARLIGQVKVEGGRVVRSTFPT